MVDINTPKNNDINSHINQIAGFLKTNTDRSTNTKLKNKFINVENINMLLRDMLSETILGYSLILENLNPLDFSIDMKYIYDLKYSKQAPDSNRVNQELWDLNKLFKKHIKKKIKNNILSKLEFQKLIDSDGNRIVAKPIDYGEQTAKNNNVLFDSKSTQDVYNYNSLFDNNERFTNRELEDDDFDAPIITENINNNNMDKSNTIAYQHIMENFSSI